MAVLQLSLNGSGAASAAGQTEVLLDHLQHFHQDGAAHLFQQNFGD
tara:strand:- start:414 stop:551 length:138 start_codon:yes stop_codon:yes gene_type:complete